MFVLRRKNAAAAIAVAVLSLGISAAAPVQPAPPVGPELHSVRAARIEVTEAPVLDGDLSELAWAKATVLDDFRQNQPNAGEPATELTVVRIMYDENNLYFGIYAYHRNPDNIIVRAMSRDGPAFTADNVRVMLDPGATRRNGYAFQVTAAGGRRDTFQQNNQQNVVQWNTLWDAKVRIVADGWITEIAIPFRSLSYSPGQADWGFEFSRQIRGSNENIRWSGYDPALDDVDVTKAGTLTGIERVSQGLGLDVQVYGTGRAEYDWQTKEGATITGTAGGSAYYRITPALTGTLTYHPDFSDSPLDNRQVNVTRFSLFLPETRDFFLRDAGAFEFGGRNFGPNNGRPFVTRSIGLVKGTPVSILLGGKLSGEYGGFDVGAVSAVIDDTATAKEQLLSMVRVSHPIFAQSKLGMILTHGDPTGASTNTLAGLDFQYRDSNFMGGDVLQSDIYYQRSYSSSSGNDDSFGVAINLPNEPWGGELRFKQVGNDFRPALGFVNRENIRNYFTRVEQRSRYRNQYLQETAFAAQSEYFTDLAGHLETRDTRLNVFLEGRGNDNVNISLRDNFESVSTDFDLPNNIIVPAGSYRWTNGAVRLQTSNARALQFTSEIICCHLYDGRGVETNSMLNFRPGETFELRIGHEGNFLKMPGGSVDIHVLSMDAIVNFTPSMQLALEAQYDNISEDFALSARYRWEYSPGNEVFLAFGQTALIPGTRFEAQTSVFTLRLGRTFQF